MKKLILMITMFFVLVGNMVYASDYPMQLAELERLLEQCEKKGMSVPYETVGVTTFERFIGYLEEDARNGVAADIMEYNHSAMQKLYVQTKANLIAYLNGEKTPASVPVYDMMNISISGKGVTDGTNNVFSNGYGFFNTAINDIENFHDFGMMNIMTETGPKQIIAVPEWTCDIVDAEAYYDVVEEDNNRALKIMYKSEQASNTYLRIRQTVTVKPSTRYYYRLSYKGKNVSATPFTIRINSGSLGQTISYNSVTSDWQKTGVASFITGEKDTSVTFDIYVDKKCDELYIDDVYLKDASENDLLSNGDFEDLYSQKNISWIISNLERAKASNVAVSFLLQPNYFWRIPGCDDMYVGSTGSGYNINDERAKAKIEQYLRTIVPFIDKCDAVRDICITNEPNFDTRLFPEFYNPKFRNYLLEKYTNLDNINNNYKSKYGNIDDIAMPSEYSKSAIFYDWVCFNEDQLTEWNSWMASIIREYTSKPLHCKLMNYFMPAEFEDRQHLLWGTDAEKFASFCDFAGNDAGCIINWEPTMRTKMMFYDYLYSVIDKPIINSEDHIISDGSTDYNDKQRKNVRYNLWQGAVHGRSISTMWVWDRSYDTNSAFNGSILTRPDCVAEAGYTSLDLMRCADDILKLSAKVPEVALFYSKTSRIFNDDHMGNLTSYYSGLLYSGKRVGFVTETSLDKLSDYQYLVIPSVTHTTPEAVEAVNKFIANGGKVIYYDGSYFSNDCMKYDKFGNALNNSTIGTQGKQLNVKGIDSIRKEFLNYFSDDRVRIIDNSTGKEVADVEYGYVINAGEIIVNLLNHTFDNTKNVSIYVDGKKISGMKNILTDEVTGDSHDVEGQVPLTLKMRYSTEKPSQPKNLRYSNNVLYWDVTENAVTYSVYYTDDYGYEVLHTTTEKNYCKVVGYGEYKIVPINTLGTEGEAATITIESPFSISFESVNISDTWVNATVNVSNNSYSFQRAVIKISTAEGKLAMSDIWLPPRGTKSFKAYFSDKTEWVKASVGNDINGNLRLSVHYEK